MSAQLTSLNSRRWSRTVAALGLLYLASHVAAAQEKAVPPPADGPYRVGGNVTRPEVISQTKPVYTEMARKARLQGTVILETIIDEEGNVTNVRVLKGLPMGLDQAAVDAVSTWKFKPATFEGKPVKVYYVLTVNFQVTGPTYLGPALVKFSAEHPDFAAALNGERWDEAAALLDAWSTDRSDDAGIGLARVYLLLHRNLPEDAWAALEGYHGTHRSEALRAFMKFALQIAQRNTLDSLTRTEAVERGLDAADLAIEAAPDDWESMLDKSALLREQAAQTSDDEEGQRLRDEADRLRARAAEVRRAALPAGAGD